MIDVDAAIILYSDSEQKRASAYHRGEPTDITALLVAAGMEDPAFGKMIAHAAVIIVEELEKQSAEA